MLLFYWVIVRDNCIWHLRKGTQTTLKASTVASWEETELCWHLLDISPRLIHLVALALAQSTAPSWQSLLLRDECGQWPASPDLTPLSMLHSLSGVITLPVSECSFKDSPATEPTMFSIAGPHHTPQTQWNTTNFDSTLITSFLGTFSVWHWWAGS